jgi:hypothetical protein
MNEHRPTPVALEKKRVICELICKPNAMQMSDEKRQKRRSHKQKNNNKEKKKK